MKNFNKNILRNIKKDKSRFISIFLIILLGSSIFAGLQSTPIIMKKSMNDYLAEHNYWDISVVGTYGFEQEDLSLIESIENVEGVTVKNRFDVMYESESKTLGLTGYGYDDFDQTSYDLLAGNFPGNNQECVIDRFFTDNEGLSIGDWVTFANNQGKKQFEIVGIVDSAQYIAKDYRGVNSLGDGSNHGYFGILNSGNENWMLPEELYDLVGSDIFNEIDIRISNSNIFTPGYDEDINQVTSDLESALENLYHDKYDEIQTDAFAQIEKNQTDLDDAIKEYEEGLSLYNEGLDEYEQGHQQYLDGVESYEQGMEQYESGWQEYLDGQDQYQAGLQEYENGYNQYLVALDEYNSGVSEYEAGLLDYNAQKAEFDLAYADIDSFDDETKADLEEQKILLEETKAALDATKIELDNAKIQLDSTKIELDQNKDILDETGVELESAREVLETTKSQLDDAKIELDENRVILDESKQTLDENAAVLADNQTKLDDAQAKIDQATKDIERLDQGKIYSFSKSQNDGVESFEQNAGAIESISYIFPIIFFLVAALVSMTTMTRMVEEQRIQNGTLLSLGFSKRNIINSYLLFVIIATLPSSIIGIISGINFFPRFIYYLYSLMLYDVSAPTFIVYDLMIILVTLMISVGIILLVTLVVAISELKEEPANLLRPKPPKMGKRILLDRITPIWKRLSFNNKVTLRNIFRYKRRFIMSIIGIAGCGALLVLAFGLKYSITETVVKQFDEINLYDYKISYAENDNDSIINFSESLVAQNDNVEVNNYYEAMVQVEDSYVNLQVEFDDNYQDLLNLVERGQKIQLDDTGAAINGKLSEILGVKVGDTIEVLYEDMYYQVEITNIFDYYYGSVMFMSDASFEDMTGESIMINRALISGNLNQLTDNEMVISQESSEEGRSDFGNQLESIDTVVLILIFAAGFLALIVIYNLTNINIQERLVEISTIKVLGFYPREIYDYIFRENIYLGIIGSIVGMFLGKIVHYYLIITVELETVQFVRHVDTKTYLISFAITMLFTILINLIMRRIVNRIDMVESLKSIE